MKAVVWGTGIIAKDCFSKKVLYRNYDIVAFTDNNFELWGKKFNGINILSPQEALKKEFDIVFIWSSFQKEIRKQLLEEFHLEKSKICTYQGLEKKLCEDLKVKYQESADTELKKVLGYYQKKGFNIYGYYEWEEKPYFVEHDNEGWPYIMFERKKMYYPKEYRFLVKDGKECVYNVLFEQGLHSPHQYVTDRNGIKDGSIIVDAGVCEGNFALRYVEKAKKIYLIETDLEWMEALRKTFAKYQDKVVFCPKFLTRYDSKTTVTLDTLVKERIDFLKMDIEGAEIDAILGGKNVLQVSDAQCAICSYHRQRDTEYIKWLMEDLGYQTSESEGYMFFVYDDGIAETMDFRKGLIYAKKIYR